MDDFGWVDLLIVLLVGALVMLGVAVFAVLFRMAGSL